MKFIGHQKVVGILGKSLESGKISQAYLFSGPEAVGKFTLARLFALAVISAKKRIDYGILDEYEKNQVKFSDLMVLLPPVEEKKGISKEKEIKAEAVRNSLKELLLYPYSGAKKVLVIDNAHRMNKTAQNVILKSLEEPNDTSMLILVTHQDNLLLPTIKSRCQKINFSLVPEKDMRNVIPEDIDIRWAMGRPGRIFRQEEKTILENENELILQLARGDLPINEKIILAGKMAENIPATKIILEKYIWLMRTKMLVAERSVEASNYPKKIEAAEKCLEMLTGTNANPKLTLENMWLKAS